MAGDGHDPAFMLDDGDLRALCHFACGVAETVWWDDGVGVDEEEKLANTDGTAVGSPGTVCGIWGGGEVDVFDGEVESFFFHVVRWIVWQSGSGRSGSVVG